MFTQYKDINSLLNLYVKEISKILKSKLVGIYLFGSLTYNDFNPGRSDIDLLTIVNKDLNSKEIKEVKKLHLSIEAKYPKYKKRIEVSYTPLNLFTNNLPPKKARPYYGEGKFWVKAPYGNEWLINNYLLLKYGFILKGKEIKKIIKPINIKDVQKACIKDLFQEWQPKINDKDFLNNSHYQSYLVLNLCRILYTIKKGELGTKKSASLWVKQNYPNWKGLIEAAEKWKYGSKINKQKETIKFIKFITNKVTLNV